jgi:hypothetical protein
MPIVKLIIWDGTVYFAVVFITNILWMLVHVLNVHIYGVSLSLFIILNLMVVNHSDTNIGHIVHPIHTTRDVSCHFGVGDEGLMLHNSIAGQVGMSSPCSYTPFYSTGSSASITTTMVGRLTLNLRMYDPAGNNELTFQSISSMLRNSQHILVEDQTTTRNEDGNDERA